MSLQIDFGKPIVMWGSCYYQDNELESFGPIEKPVTSYLFHTSDVEILKNWLLTAPESFDAMNNTLQCIAVDHEGKDLLHMWFQDFQSVNPFAKYRDTNELFEKLHNLIESWRSIGIHTLSFEFYKRINLLTV